jgi:hypothetical protein
VEGRALVRASLHQLLVADAHVLLRKRRKQVDGRWFVAAWCMRPSATSVCGLKQP